MTVVLGLQFDVDREQGETRNGFIWEGGLGKSIKEEVFESCCQYISKTGISTCLCSPSLLRIFTIIVVVTAPNLCEHCLLLCGITVDGEYVD